MKKVISIILCMLMIIGVAACGNSADQPLPDSSANFPNPNQPEINTNIEEEVSSLYMNNVDYDNINDFERIKSLENTEFYMPKSLMDEVVSEEDFMTALILYYAYENGDNIDDYNISVAELESILMSPMCAEYENSFCVIDTESLVIANAITLRDDNIKLGFNDLEEVELFINSRLFGEVESKDTLSDEVIDIKNESNTEESNADTVHSVESDTTVIENDIANSSDSNTDLTSVDSYSIVNIVDFDETKAVYDVYGISYAVEEDGSFTEYPMDGKLAIAVDGDIISIIMVTWSKYDAKPNWVDLTIKSFMADEVFDSEIKDRSKFIVNLDTEENNTDNFEGNTESSENSAEN